MVDIINGYIGERIVNRPKRLFVVDFSCIEKKFHNLPSIYCMRIFLSFFFALWIALSVSFALLPIIRATSLLFIPVIYNPSASLSRGVRSSLKAFSNLSLSSVVRTVFSGELFDEFQRPLGIFVAGVKERYVIV